MSDIERELRDSLAENARHAPAGNGLAERIIAEAQHGRGRERRTARSRWRAWSLPAVAAACVAGVVASIVLVASLQHPKTHSAATPTLYTTLPPTSAAATSPAPATGTPASSNNATSNAPASTASGTVPIPPGFRVADVTFVGTEDGWALGSGQCFKSPSQVCPALLHTSDGGRTWTTVGQPPPNTAHIRFADQKIGYAYRQNALFMTTDGGAHWVRQSGGGADALETLSHNVIRVTDAGNCPPVCSYQVLTAPVGGGPWQPAPLPGSVTGDSVVLSRTGDAAYLLIRQNSAGGAGSEQPTLLASSDKGRSWRMLATPCPQAGGEVDANLMTTAEDGALALVCAPRLNWNWQFAVTSTDRGVTFQPGAPRALGGSPVEALGAASSSVLLASADDTYRSTDGGKSWHPLRSAGPGRVSWIGFENASAGRAVSRDSRTIWTTTDAGATWTSHTFQ